MEKNVAMNATGIVEDINYNKSYIVLMTSGQLNIHDCSPLTSGALQEDSLCTMSFDPWAPTN